MNNRKVVQLLEGSRKWFSISAKAEAKESAEVFIYDYIGWGGVTAQSFIEELKAIEASKITVAINTPGGDVFDGLAIYNALRSHPAEIITKVEGLAASIGSIIALGGDQVIMADASFMMIHNPWAVAMGSAKELRDMAETLEKVGGTLAGVYAGKSGMSLKEAHRLMDDETWYTAQEAVDAKLADSIAVNEKDGDGAAKAAARFDLSCYRHAPDALKAQAAQPDQGAALKEGASRSAHMKRRLALVERGGFSR